MRRTIFAVIICLSVAVFGVHASNAAEPIIKCGSDPMRIRIGDIIDCGVDINYTQNFYFDASAGDTIRITMVDRTSGSETPYLKLYDPDGNRISYWYIRDEGRHVDYNLSKTGRYAIVISELSDDQEVEFRIALQGMVPSPAEARILKSNIQLDGEIDPFADSDVFFFNGTVGDTIRITMTDMTIGSETPYLKLYDPDGKRISYWYVRDEGRHVDYNLSMTGRYTIVICELDDNQEVEFRIALQGIVPSTSDARRICHGEPYKDDIDPFSDSDAFFFNGTIGDTIRITMTDMTIGSETPYLKLYDPDGKRISYWYVRDKGRHVDYNLSKTGRYTIVICELDDNQEVTYRLSFNCIIGNCFDPCPRCEPFKDVCEGYWAYDSIVAIYEEGITKGCSQNPMLYCPKRDVTREQMAAFIVRAVEGEPPANYCSTGSPFSDVPSTSVFCKYIKRLSEMGITQGCGGGKYCPKTTVTREQMAAFLVRAVEGEPPANYCGTGSPFSDVSPASVFCKYIKRLSELEITKGCGGDKYCPKTTVKRDQMAVFLDRAFLEMD